MPTYSYLTQAVPSAARRQPGRASLTYGSRRRTNRELADRDAGYKCPASIDFTDALPPSAAGRVLKTQSRAGYARRPEGG